MKNKTAIFFTVLLIGLLSIVTKGSSELALIPLGQMEKGGYVEFGTFIDQNKTTVNDERIDVPVASFYTRLGLSDNLEYNLKVRHDMTTLHNFHISFFRYNTHNDSVNHYFGGGVKNVGWQNPSSDELKEVAQYKSINIPIVSGYMSYGMASADGDSSIHIGVASDSNRNGVALGIAGIEKNFIFGRLMVEYNGKAPIVGLKYAYKNYLLYFAYTLGNAKDESIGNDDSSDDVQTQMFSLGISYRANLVDQFKHMFATKKEIDDFQSDLRFRMEKLERLIEKDQILRESKFLEDLEESLTKALTGETGSPKENKELSIKRAYDHMQKGLEYYYDGDFQKSLKEYDTAVNIIPTSTFAHMRLGSINYQLKNYERAKKHWKTALSLEPNNEALKKQVETLLTPEEIEKFESAKLNQELKTDPSKLSPDRARKIKLKKIKDLFKDFKVSS